MITRLEQGFAMGKGKIFDFMTVLMKEAGPEATMSSLPDSDLPTDYLMDAMAFVNRFQNLSANSFGHLIKCYM